MADTTRAQAAEFTQDLKSQAKPGLSPADVHVLLVDDERLSRTVVSNLLRRCDYTVTTAENGAEAMELLRSNSPGTFNLVLTDVCMPEVDGIQLLQYVKQEENLRSVPVIMMSSIEKGDTVYECVSSGAEEYLVKPVTRKEVQHMWQYVLRKRSALATVPQAPVNSSALAVEGTAAHAAPQTTAGTSAEGGVVQNIENVDLDAAKQFLLLMQSSRITEAAKMQRQIDAMDSDMTAIRKILANSENTAAAVDQQPAAKRQKIDNNVEWNAISHRLSALEPLYFERRRGSRSAMETVEALAKDVNILARSSDFSLVASLRAGDVASPQEMVCCADFDADDRHFATVSVSRSVKVFDFEAVLASPAAFHVPIWQTTTRSKLSSVSWNAYIRPHLITSDYDGLIQLWDASVGPSAEAAQFEEHSRRVWSIDFSKADPLRFVSGSDDATIRVWNVNQESSAVTMRAPANVCSVQFSPTNGNLIAAGCANHRVYLFDLRKASTPAAIISGPTRAVSYVRFMGSNAVVAASTDNIIRTWDLENALSSAATTTTSGAGFALTPTCTFTGHRNERNFVGLSATDDGYIATGSEDNSVHAYYRTMPFSVASHGLTTEKGESKKGNSSSYRSFVSSVCWARGGKHCLAGNSQGVLSVLRLQ